MRLLAGGHREHHKHRKNSSRQASLASVPATSSKESYKVLAALVGPAGLTRALNCTFFTRFSIWPDILLCSRLPTQLVLIILKATVPGDVTAADAEADRSIDQTYRKIGSHLAFHTPFPLNRYEGLLSAFRTGMYPCPITTYGSECRGGNQEFGGRALCLIQLETLHSWEKVLQQAL